MRPLDYLRILRRRWWILVVGVLIGSLFAFATRPSELSVAQATSPKYSYRATHLLIANPTSTGGGLGRAIGYDRLALMTIRGDVPTKAMARLDALPVGATVEKSTSSADSSSSDGANSAVRKRQRADDPQIPNFRGGQGTLTVVMKNPFRYVVVAAVPDPATGALGIIATADRVTAAKVANVFSEELLAAIQRLAQTDYQATLAGYADDLELANGQVAALQLQISQTVDPIAHNSLTQRLLDVQGRIDEIKANTAEALKKGPQVAPLGTLEAATPERETFIKTPGGTALGAGQRQLVGGAIGFFLALALLVIMELVGARIRDVAGTEGAARMPVIAEIPVVKMNRADRFVVATAADPASLTAEAYRSLRTSLLAMWQRHPKNVPLDNVGSTPGSAGRRPLRTLLVTSPGPAEGKSISVVNLAAAFAETGVTVIVIDADFRRPTQTRYFDRPRNPNLGDIDLTCEPEDLAAILQDTDVPGVRLAASAPTKSDPGHAIAVAKAAVAAAVQLADIVIVDSPPILLANDAADLALGVDASILLARSGWTRRSGIVSAAELLRRLEATVIGVVIVGAEHGARAGYYGYYGYYGYGYGYAHPGEVSIMHRLMPWKAAHKSQSGSRTGSPGSGSGSRPAPPPAVDVLPRQSSAPDSDDPWV